MNLSTFTNDQKKAHKLINDPSKRVVMISGGQRSGKTTIISECVFERAMSAPNSKHLIAHQYANVCHRNLWKKSFPEMLNIILPGWYAELKAARDGNGSPKHIRESEHCIILPNDSEIHFWGLDDPEKLRGAGFSTAFINEANLVDYETFTTVQGRLSESPMTLYGTPLVPKLIIDLNPTTKASWEYELFVSGVVPQQRTPLPNPSKYGWMRINPSSNISNLPAGYMEDTFGGMSEQQRLRDEYGEWADDNPEALFSISDIQRGDIDPDDLAEIVIAVDPATTSKKDSDRTGIIVAGRTSDHKYYVLEDATMKAKPDEWATKLVELYEKYNATQIVAETNQGGDMIASLIRLSAPSKNIPIRGEWSSNNKRGRALRVSVLYQQNKVHHVTCFSELEQEMISFDAPTFRGSPDRLDALVYALAALSGIRTSGPLRQRQIGGFLGA